MLHSLCLWYHVAITQKMLSTLGNKIIKNSYIKFEEINQNKYIAPNEVERP